MKRKKSSGRRGKSAKRATGGMQGGANAVSQP